MPTLSSSSSSVFGKFRRQQSDPTQQTPTPSLLPAEEKRLLALQQKAERSPYGNHKRDSSILSLSSVTDLGNSVKRSVSLRSHRSQLSGGSFGHKARYPSNGNLVSENLLESPKEEAAPISDTLGRAPPSRGRLGASGRSFSQKLRSTETLSTFATHDLPEDRPSTQAGITDPKHKTPFSMLAAPQQFGLPRRQTSDRPTITSQPSHARDIPLLNQTNGMSVPAGAGSATPLSAGGHDSQAVHKQIHDTSAKRMATLDYMRKAHEGNMFYFNTLHYTTQSSAHLPSLQANKLGRRATNYLVLGYSLPALLDMNSNSPSDYLKAFAALLQEFETYQHLSSMEGSGSALSRGRVGQMFKSSMGLGARSGKGRRSSSATDALGMNGSMDSSQLSMASHNSGTSFMEAHSPIHMSNHDFQYLLTPHLPFDPDFGTTFSTLCDALIDAYSNLLNMLPNAEACGPGIGDAFAKADKAVRKILVANVVREFEDQTRAGVKSEVAGLGRLVLGGLM